ncbi:MAG TPA: response regulator [Candidatus Acidoferrum sp.]|nr:response regulator [Candidatus Acidoferrum sp.]
MDDDPIARQSIKLLLNIDRHDVTEAQDAEEAQKLFTQKIFDLVISDYFMPNALGNELAVNLWRISPSTPFLMVTGYYEKLVNSGVPAEAILAKPFGPVELRQAIAKVLG